MKRMTILLCCMLLAGSALAQTVYESKGGQGKVYSDRPVPGGKPVDLKPLNVIEAAPVAPASPKPAAETAKPAAKPSAAYRSLAVVFPEAGGSVAANNATFEVRVSIDPPLQIEQGHAFSLRMDGRPVPGRYTATEMMIPPEFFGDVAPAGVQQHVLEASVVDAQGSSILSAAPVSFQTRFVTVLQRPHAPGQMPGSINTWPPHSQKPLPKPVPKPLPEPSPESRPATETRR
jgi:hypothetical protein